MERNTDRKEILSVLRRFTSSSLMRMMVAVMAVGLLASCSEDDDTQEGQLKWYEDTAMLESDFLQALYEAQSPTPEKESHSLWPITDDNPDLEWKDVVRKGDGSTAHMVLVCAMLNHNDMKYWLPNDTFRISKWNGLWVTIPQEWDRNKRAYEGMDSVASRMRMIQMLGLRPDCRYDTMVEFYIDVDGLFRPAHDPDITTTSVAAGFANGMYDNYVVGETNFQEWFNYNLSVAYTGNGACPWTQLGYTYDWHHGADREGLSEYVASFNTLAYIKSRESCWTFIRKMMWR